MGRSDNATQLPPGNVAPGTGGANKPAIAARLAPALLLILALAWRPAPAEVLTIEQAGRIALGGDPAVAASRERASALSESAVADGQLPDPKLKFGLFNLPAESLDIEQEPTTQLRFGVSQALPRGRTLHFRQRHGEWRADAVQAGAEDAGRKVVRDVRDTFLELYYQVRAHHIIDESRALFAQLVDITGAHYATGRASQQDVLRAELELSRLDDRATRIRMAEDAARATLAKWLGDVAQWRLAKDFPELPALPGREALAAGLDVHPAITAAKASTGAADEAVRIAGEQYKPGFNVGVEYRKRFADNPDGSDREDMLAAMLTMDMPLFTGKRQDRRLAASQHRATAARLERDDRMRGLREILGREYANWQRLGERRALYEEQLLRDARAHAEASLSAYQNGVTEFNTLMRARVTELDVRLDDLRVRVDRAKTRARLLYLATGERS